LAQIWIRRTAGVLASALTLVGAGGGAARGDGALRITDWPSLTGTATLGAELDAVGARWTGPDDTTVSWYWLRCDDQALCRVIDNAHQSHYTPGQADVGARLIAWLRITAKQRFVDAWTLPSGVVAPAPPKPAPVPPPAPTPVPPPTPPPPPAPAPGFTAAAPVAAPAPQRTVRRPRVLRPRPTVRISGWLTAGGARVTLLSVRAPRGVRITARCRGGDCGAPRTVLARTRGRDTRLRGFERILAAGTRVEIRVTKRGYVGKLTVITIRRGRAPTRLDRCVSPLDGGPVRCPAR
jgi:hypothetical protein